MNVGLRLLGGGGGVGGNDYLRVLLSFRLTSSLVSYWDHLETMSSHPSVWMEHNLSLNVRLLHNYTYFRVPQRAL